MTDPTVNGQVLDANLGCTVPYQKNPYVKNSGSKIPPRDNWFFFVLIFAMAFGFYAD